MTASDARLHELLVRWSFLATLPIAHGQHKGEPSHALDDARDPLIAIDSDRVRCLLVPIEGHGTVPLGTSGAAIKITAEALSVDGQSGWFLRVACIEPSLYDRFAMLIADILEAIADAPGDPGGASLKIVAQWQDLLRADSVKASREALAGLFAELLFLEDVLDASPGADVSCWVGPDGQRHDFLRGGFAVEVKATLTHTGRRASIHGIDQLEPQTPNGKVFLSWSRLEVAIGAGESVADLLARIKGKTDYSAALAQKVDALKFDMPHEPAQIRFIVRERSMYAVEGSFPRLTRAQLLSGHELSGVGVVNYDVDLATAACTPMVAAEVSSVVKAMGSAT